jgi:hypothetical protein
MRIAALFFAFLVLGWGRDQGWQRAADDDRAAPIFPARLQPGKPVLAVGERVIVPKGTVVMRRDSVLTEVKVRFLRLIPAKKDQWEYEIRPLGSEPLRVEVGKDAFSGVLLLSTAVFSELAGDTTLKDRASITWLDQPYEIRDRAGKLLFTTKGKPRK